MTNGATLQPFLESLSRQYPSAAVLSPTESTLADTDAESHRSNSNVNRQLTAASRIDNEPARVFLQALYNRVETLEAELEAKDRRIDHLEHDRDRLEETTTDLREQVRNLENELEGVNGKAAAALNKAETNKTRLLDLQSRELEKGAHLRTETIDEHEIDVSTGRLERITKDDGQAYYRLPAHADPLDRGGDISLAYGDLLPIQQLARMDADMRRSAANSLPTRLATQLWEARVDSRIGDSPWENGCKGIRESVKASDLKHWIRRQETGISDAYAKKLVSRVIDAALDLSKNRLAVRKKRERKNGLEYTERRLILPEDVAIPGDRQTNRPSDPETAGVHG